MFKGKRNGTSTSARAQAQGRAELQHQVEGRLGLWRLFLEAKWQELEEHRNPAGLQATPVVASARAAPVAASGTARTRARRAEEELPNENTPVVERSPTDDGRPQLDGEAA